VFLIIFKGNVVYNIVD